jgi:hypothetical protein
VCDFVSRGKHGSRSKPVIHRENSTHHVEAFLRVACAVNAVSAKPLILRPLFTCTASAQAASNKAAAADSAAFDRATSAHKEGEWRAFKLVGVNVYNEANEKIGDINEVILDKAGKVENVVLGVGGFLGMGEHYVAVAYDKLKWSNQPPRSTTASTTTSTTNRPAPNADSNARAAEDGTATAGAARTTAEDRKVNGYWYPDHAIYYKGPIELNKSVASVNACRGGRLTTVYNGLRNRAAIPVLARLSSERTAIFVLPLIKCSRRLSQSSPQPPSPTTWFLRKQASPTIHVTIVKGLRCVILALGVFDGD